MYSLDVFLQDMSHYLAKIKRRYPSITNIPKNITQEVASPYLFSPEIYIHIASLYEEVQREQNVLITYLQEEKKSRIDEIDQNEQPHEDNTSERTSLLFSRHSQRETTELNACAFHEISANLYKQLNAVYSYLLLSKDQLNEHQATFRGIKTFTERFEHLLSELSEYLETLRFPMRSSAFSVGLYLDKLEFTYKAQYQSSYPGTFFIRTIFRHSDRIPDIHFIMQVNKHSDTTDEIRTAIMYTAVEKIMNSEKSSSINTSLLKNILDAGLERISDHRPTNEAVQKVGVFCTNHSVEITPPENFRRYIDRI
jgi:hypothetical protein